ncbi:MAG: hypothetical protein WEG36_15990 [Gemmatimonadota bacterium]
MIWAEARDRGVRLRVSGNEPGWYAEVQDGNSPEMRLVLHYGERDLLLPRSLPLSDALGYRAVASGDSVTLRVTGEPCSDSMSGWDFPLSADLVVNGRQYRGCGRFFEN